MRRLLPAVRPVLLFALPLLLAACAGDERERLVIYSPHGKELLGAYETAFEAAHPEVDVQWLDMGSQAAYDRVRTERANPQASLWWGAPHIFFDRAAAEDLLEPFAPSWAAAVGADAHDAQDRWYGTYLTPEVLAYNTEALDSASAPRDWDDLLEPRFKDRVLVRSPLESGTMVALFAAMIGRQPTVEEGYRWLARLDANTKTYAADPTQLYLKLARGEGDVTLWNLPDILLQQEGGYPFAYRLPASGTPVIVDGIALVKGAPNAVRAREFYEFVTTREALVDQARRFHRIPVRTDVPRDSLPGWMAALDLRPLPLDRARLAADAATWMRHWDEQIRGRGEEYLRQNGAPSTTETSRP